MNQYPDISQYCDSIKNLSHTVSDIRFKGGQPKPASTLSGLWYGQGGFSCVYQIQLNNKTSAALRTWTAHIDQLPERYKAIAAYLSANKLPYFVDFDYIDKGIAVAMGQSVKHYPILFMEWADGMRLNEFIEKYLNQPQTIIALAQEFADMVKSLHNYHISHGDLQNGNILVTLKKGKPRILLIDYDSLFVPSLKGWPVSTKGLPEYQHPQYGKHGMTSEKADYFSELVIYLSLLVYAECPRLWKHKQEKELLFEEKDFENPAMSQTFKHLATFSPKVRELAQQLQSFCAAKSIEHLLPLESVLAGNKISIVSMGKPNRPLDDIFGGSVTPSVKGSSSPVGTVAMEPIFGTTPAQPGRSKTHNPYISSVPIPVRFGPSYFQQAVNYGMWAVFGCVILIILLTIGFGFQEAARMMINFDNWFTFELGNRLYILFTNQWQINSTLAFILSAAIFGGAFYTLGMTIYKLGKGIYEFVDNNFATLATCGVVVYVIWYVIQNWWF